MLHSISDYVASRKPVLTRMAAYTGGGYIAVNYLAERMRDMRIFLQQSDVAKDNIARRFERNQEDIGHTIMLLLPDLATKILEDMDVESITQELQSQTRASKAHSAARTPLPSSDSSMASSVEIPPNPPPIVNDARSDNGSVSVVSYNNAEEPAAGSDLAASSHSWVERMSATSSATHSSPEASSSIPPGTSVYSYAGSPRSNVGTELSDSFLTTSSAISYGDTRVAQESSPSAFPKTKAELWREVKMLTFTRTLTTMYSITLLSLFVHLQLNILGRCKYIQSLLLFAIEEKDRERLRDSLSLTSLLWNGSLEQQDDDDSDLLAIPPISMDTERKYLTLTWWLLNRGWTAVGDRVTGAVHEVFEGVSLKSKLSAFDLQRLINEVREKVEIEIPASGGEQRSSLVSAFLPSTAETVQYVLAQGGVNPGLASTPDPQFDALLAETRMHLESKSFKRVLDVSLEKATEILFDGLERNLFDSPEGQADPESALGLTSERRVRLAGMLPGLARWCHLALHGFPNDLIDNIAAVREVEAFSAIIYTNYDELLK